VAYRCPDHRSSCRRSADAAGSAHAFRRHAGIQGQFHSPEYDLFVVMKDKGKDIGHLTITPGAAEHLVLQLSKGQRQFQERCTIKQGTGFALDDGKVMPPVVIVRGGLPWLRSITRPCSHTILP
jgi:hypothetical protein